eukprot:1266131-Lingulodinium_polyedra.AAC.1
MRDLGLGQDFEDWAPTSAAPDGWKPMEQPRSATLRVLKAAWAAREWRAVARRRADMAHLEHGVDSMPAGASLDEGASSRTRQGPCG